MDTSADALRGVVDAAFWIRVSAARDLVAVGELDGWKALEWMLWPSKDVAAASETVARTTKRRGYSNETKQRALELVDSGLSWAAVGRRLGVPKPTVGMWVRAR